MKNNNSASRRTFLSDASMVTAAGLVGAEAVLAKEETSNDILRIGLIGCGGRGSGAAVDAMKADPNVRLVAMADLFRDRLDASKERLRKIMGDKFAVQKDHEFVGFDAYRELLNTDVDVVLLTTPPHFRPAHLKAAIEAGKHVFAEKPVAVDATGVRSVMKSARLAREKGVSIQVGFMLRYSKGMRETMERIHGGQLGRIVTLQTNYNIAGMWAHDRQPGWSDVEWQLRNWFNFTWLSGGQLVEQHVHGIDLMSWAMQDEYPETCFALGGRQSRNEPIHGHIFDHHAVCYEYSGGQRTFAFCRNQDGTDVDTSQLVFGEKGTADLMRNTMNGESGTWRYSRARRRDRGSDQDLPYVQEHEALFAGIRSGELVNAGEKAAKSSLMAIMGRMASYTGKNVTWEQALRSEEDLTPTSYEFGSMDIPPVAQPGKTTLL